MPDKFYTVWKGHLPGIYTTWKECQQQIKSYRGPIFKSFPTRALAEKAFNQDPGKWIGNRDFVSSLTPFKLRMIGEPIMESISVAAFIKFDNNQLAWRGIFTYNKEEIFHSAVYQTGSVKLGDFLAIVEALKYCGKNKCDYPIYSDNASAIKWVKDKSVQDVPRIEINSELYNLVDEARDWLNSHDYANPIIKWESAAWGDNLAEPVNSVIS